MECTVGLKQDSTYLDLRVHKFAFSIYKGAVKVEKEKKSKQKTSMIDCESKDSKEA